MSDASTQRRKLAAILMADVSGFSAMMGRDEERTTALIQAFHQRVEKIVQEHEGRVVDTAGDSVFGEFDSVVHRVEPRHRCRRCWSRRGSVASVEHALGEAVRAVAYSIGRAPADVAGRGTVVRRDRRHVLVVGSDRGGVPAVGG